MWDDILKHLPDFRSVVVTSRDVSGYPFSVRCQASADTNAHVLRLHLPNVVTLQPGAASLLYHRHDAQLWNLYSFLLRGTLVQAADGWRFQPQQFIPGAGIGGMLGLFRLICSGRRKAKKYLARRGLPRPAIPWDAINALKPHNQGNKQRSSG
jgi:hypothetical protein